MALRDSAKRSLVSPRISPSSLRPSVAQLCAATHARCRTASSLNANSLDKSCLSPAAISFGVVPGNRAMTEPTSSNIASGVQATGVKEANPKRTAALADSSNFSIWIHHDVTRGE